MRVCVLLLALAGMLNKISPAQALVDEDLLPSVLRNIKEISVIVDDNVEHGCWTNVSAVKAIVESGLLRENIKLIDTGITQATLSINAAGFSVSNKKNGLHCAVHLQMNLDVMGKTQFRSGPNESVYSFTNVWERGNLSFSGGHQNSNTTIRSKVADWMSELIAEILKARHSR